MNWAALWSIDFWGSLANLGLLCIGARFYIVTNRRLDTLERSSRDDRA